MKTKISLLFLLIALTACEPAAISAPTETTSPTRLAFTPTAIPPTAPATLIILQQPPPCTFPFAQTTMEESTPQKYAFSEPRIVKTSNSGLELVEWLPDSQRVLLTESIRDTSKEKIEVFNPETGETHIIAVREQNMWFRPVWVENLKSVVYSDWLLVSQPVYEDGIMVPSSVIGRQQLWLADGNNIQLLEDVQYTRSLTPHEYVTSAIAIKPDGSYIVFLKSTGELPWSLYSRMISNDGLKPEQQLEAYGDIGGEGVWLEPSNKMTWRPYTSQIFFYSFASPTDLSFLLDIDSGQVCSLGFGGWVYFARWSPNGRYLAVVKSQGPLIPLSASYDLIVVDTATGIQYQIDSSKIGPPEMADCCRHIVEAIAWAPDSRQLVIIGTADFSGTGTHIRHDRLYLVDFVSGSIENLFPDFEVTSNFFGSGVTWSPDGSKLLVTCPTQIEGRLCLIRAYVPEQ